MLWNEVRTPDVDGRVTWVARGALEEEGGGEGGISQLTRAAWSILRTLAREGASGSGEDSGCAEEKRCSYGEKEGS